MAVKALALLAVVGPTATGKTPLAVELAARIGGEIVNADSRQLYKSMDIGTAKSSREEQDRIRHWLIDIADPGETCSLGTYVDMAREALDDCWRRNVVPIVTGGTGQYVWALLEGWNVPRVPPDAELRASLEQEIEAKGLQPLLDELAAVDPGYAEHVDIQNARRVIRAVEILRLKGLTPSACRTRTPPDATVCVIGLSCPRGQLYERIDQRVDAMIAAGLIAEVEALIDQGFSCDLSAMSGIGYKQICQHLAGDLSRDQAIERIKTATHRLARMQHAWFRQADERIHWIDVTAGDPLAEALRIVESET